MTFMNDSVFKLKATKNSSNVTVTNIWENNTSWPIKNNKLIQLFRQRSHPLFYTWLDSFTKENRFKNIFYKTFQTVHQNFSVPMIVRHFTRSLKRRFVGETFQLWYRYGRESFIHCIPTFHKSKTYSNYGWLT